MKPAPVMIAMTMTAALLAAACGGGTEQESAPPFTEAATGDAAITFTSQPDPPRMGENTFEVLVTSGGQPVADADVAVEFFMPAMPAMNMAEMRNSIPLAHEGGGRYRGAGNVMMAGNWEVTVTARRDGQELASRTLSITAK